jgi:hypothetical protein
MGRKSEVDVLTSIGKFSKKSSSPYQKAYSLDPALKLHQKRSDIRIFFANG